LWPERRDRQEKNILAFSCLLCFDLLVSDGCRVVCVTVREVMGHGVFVGFPRFHVSFPSRACRGIVLSVAAPTLNVGCCMKPC
jgi:hypothetical protein